MQADELIQNGLGESDRYPKTPKSSREIDPRLAPYLLSNRPRAKFGTQ
jgi:hypothetical protein